jgi:uncharacterized phage protein gp47/JayE
MIPSPIILYPKTNWSATGDNIYYSDNTIQAVSGYVPITDGEIELNTIIIVKQRYKIDRNSVLGSWSQLSADNMTIGLTYSGVTSIPWSFTSEDLFDLYIGDKLTLEFTAFKVSNQMYHIGEVIDQSNPITLISNIVAENDITGSADPISGMKIKRFKDSIKLMVPSSGINLNPNNDFSGCNFYLSLTAGGGDSGYSLINNVPIVDVDDLETEEEILAQSETEDQTNNLIITTTKSQQIITTYYTLIFNKTVIAELIQEGKIPNIFLSDGETIRSDVIYYFVSTVRTYDTSLNELIESPYSQELEGQFMIYTTDYQFLPKRSRDAVLFSISKDMMSNNEMITIVPGSVIRDISDPIAYEFEKMYVIQDFIFSCQSLDTLVEFDDSDHDGVSDPVSTSNRKRALAGALGVTDTVNLQSLINEQFDKYAANSDLTRKGATKATGTVLFYTEIRPTSDVIIPDNMIVSTTEDFDLNIQTVNFVVVGSKIIDSTQVDLYYNPTLKRYELECDIEAVNAGSDSNVPAGSITSITNAPPSFRVTNIIPTKYGSDQESNNQLADRIKIARMDYDSGTEGGYNSTAMDVPGVLQVRVEIAGDSLMVRDYSDASKKHIGGKVDAYIRGNRITQLVDQVAFNYEYPTDSYGNKVGEIFSVTDANDFRLRCPNTKVSSTSPIIIVSKVRNVTKGQEYSLSNIQIIGDGDTILLEKNQTNINIGLSTFDVVEVSYLYRSSNELILSQQPVESVVSVTTSGGDTVDPSKYQLIKIEDPLINGNSSIAKDSVKFYFNENDNIQEFVSVTEDHDMLLGTPARLTLKGVDTSSIVVTPEGGGDAYILDIDYSITIGSNIEYTYINLLSNSMIRHGDTVQIFYEASENFNVTYTSNDLVEQVQEKFNSMKHACADAIVKQSVRNFLDLSFKVTRKVGVDVSTLKYRITTAVANYVSRLKMGDTLTQSDVASAVRAVEGVANVTIPFTRMMKRNSSFIPLDYVGNTSFEVYSKMSSSGVTSYRSINNVLTYNTSDNGGDSNFFRGIYEDNKLLNLVSSPTDVSKSSGNSYIQADGKIIVSTTDGRPPQVKYYKVSYYTYYSASENPVSDIETAEIEYLDIDSLSLRDIEIVDEKVNKRGL